MASRRFRGLLLLILLMVPSLLSDVPFNTVMGQPSEGSISFQPSEMPNLTFDYNVAEYRFELTWKTYYLHLEPFAIYNNQTLEFYQIIPWIKNNYPNVDYRWAVTKFKNYNRWGYWLENLPQNVADNLDYLGYRLDYNFPLSAVEIEWEQALNYTFPRIQLGKAITLDFMDLYEHGFTLEVNKTHLMIGNVKGKTDLDLDPITYSSPTITVTGYTEGTPCNFWDLWNASSVNGWNVVNNTCNTQFKFWAKIMIGDGAIETWFADTSKQIVLANGTVGSWAKWFQINDNANFRLGEVVDATEKSSKAGCDLITLESINRIFIISGTSDSNVELYSSSFVNPASSRPQMIANEIHRIWHCTTKGNVSLEGTANTDIFNFVNCYGGFLIVNPNNNTIDTLFGVSVDQGFYASYGFTVSNMRMIDTRTRMGDLSNAWESEGDIYLIDCISDLWTFSYTNSSSEVLRQYTFNLTVVDSDGTLIEDANVDLTYSGQGGGTVGTWETGVNGSIPSQTLSKGFYNQTGGDTIYPYEPYNLTVSALDYDTESFIFNISEPTSWVIALRESVFDVEVNTSIGILPLFLGFMALVVILAANKRRR